MSLFPQICFSSLAFAWAPFCLSRAISRTLTTFLNLKCFFFIIFFRFLAKEHSNEPRLLKFTRDAKMSIFFRKIYVERIVLNYQASLYHAVFEISGPGRRNFQTESARPGAKWPRFQTLVLSSVIVETFYLSNFSNSWDQIGYRLILYEIYMSHIYFKRLQFLTAI